VRSVKETGQITSKQASWEMNIRLYDRTLLKFYAKIAGLITTLFLKN
jgi:hypothetical protein